MGKRLTIRRELKKRLSESKSFLKYQPMYKDITQVCGGPYDEEVETQFEINMKNDIDQIEFILWCLDNRESIESRRNLMIEKDS